MLFQRKREDVPRRIEPENGIPHVRILSAYGNQMTRVERLFEMPSLRGWCESAGSSASCRPQNRLSDSTSHARPRIQIQIEPLCVVPRDSPITRDNKIRSRRNASRREKKALRIRPATLRTALPARWNRLRTIHLLSSNDVDKKNRDLPFPACTAVSVPFVVEPLVERPVSACLGVLP